MVHARQPARQGRRVISRRRLILLLIALAVAAYRYYLAPPPPVPNAPAPTPTAQTGDPCGGSPECFAGPVARVIDGDTLDIAVNGGGERRVRLVLVDAPERDTSAGPVATRYLAQLCRPGSLASAWPDSRQPRDEYGRTLAVVWCSNENVNARMIRAGHAQLYRRFCRVSSFGHEPWARELGCK